MTKTEIIEELLAEFDFETVKEVRDSLDWKMALPKAEYRLATVEELKECAKKLLESAVNNDTKWVTSGGFIAGKDFYYDGDNPMKEYYLYFILERASVNFPTDEEKKKI